MNRAMLNDETIKNKIKMVADLLIGQRENVFDGSLFLMISRGSESLVYCRAHTICSHLGAI